MQPIAIINNNSILVARIGQSIGIFARIQNKKLKLTCSENRNYGCLIRNRLRR